MTPQHVAAATSYRRFAQLFRAHAYAGVEYSFDARPDRYGVMVAGRPGDEKYIGQCTSGLSFTSQWQWSLRRFIESERPTAYLIRADVVDQHISKLMVYCRFAHEPNETGFAQAVERLAPVKWTGSDPLRVARALSVPGPRGIGFGVDAEGSYDLSVYFRVTAACSLLTGRVVEQLLAATQYSSDLLRPITDDLHGLYSGGPPGVIGIDNGVDGRSASLKFNPANVPLTVVWPFLASHGAQPSRLEQIAETTQALRALRVSYLGVRYSPTGFAGWRIYLSTTPQRSVPVGSARLRLEAVADPTIPLPHY